MAEIVAYEAEWDVEVEEIAEVGGTDDNQQEEGGQ